MFLFRSVIVAESSKFVLFFGISAEYILYSVRYSPAPCGTPAKIGFVNLVGYFRNGFVNIFSNSAKDHSVY